MASTDAEHFRLAVLNPAGHDDEQHFPDGAGAVGGEHPPTNFHAYAACTRGSFFRETKNALASDMSILLLIRGDFKDSERALNALKKKGRTVVVSLKETGMHQIANQLRDQEKLLRFLRIIHQADGCIASTPEAADLYRMIRGEPCAFIPTPYPVEDSRWDFSTPIQERRGIFIGTREWNVPSRNHLAALLVARKLSERTGESVTVYNFDRGKGQGLLDELSFPAGKLRVLAKKVPYSHYLREMARHKIVLQLDTSFVPGQVAGDAVLCRVPCVGSNGAIDRLAFPATCGTRSIEEIEKIAWCLLTDGNFDKEIVDLAENSARTRISFALVAEQLREFFANLNQTDQPIASK
ncbi:MAG: hypothetical protein QOI04_120 [Verrucomicrobiota bacterium]|jgi:hypothetical protein